MNFKGMLNADRLAGYVKERDTLFEKSKGSSKVSCAMRELGCSQGPVLNAAIPWAAGLSAQNKTWCCLEFLTAF
jgi:hypothetical protein